MLKAFQALYLNTARLVPAIMAVLLAAITAVPACAPSPAAELVFGALLPLTGNLSSSGEASRAGLEIAARDINLYLESIDSGVRVRLILEDTRADPAVALEKLKSLAERDVRIVIGPDPSAEVEAVRAYAGENGILIVSHGSTAPSLAIPGDNVFRLCPDDSHQAEAVSRLMWEDGIRAVVPLWRGDVWGDDLSKVTKVSFERLGGIALKGVRYSPTTEEFSAEIQSLSAIVSQATVQYGAGAVAVHLMAFEEVVPLFVQLEQQKTMLPTVKWYGSDGTAMNKVLINSAPATRFAIRTGFTNPTQAVGRTDEYALVGERIQKMIGRTPEYSAFNAYDALWIAAKASLAAGTNRPDALKRALMQEAGHYFGATGWTVLNEAGDRKFGDIDFWAVEVTRADPEWRRVASYQVAPGFPGNLYRRPPISVGR